MGVVLVLAEWRTCLFAMLQTQKRLRCYTKSWWARETTRGCPAISGKKQLLGLLSTVAKFWRKKAHRKVDAFSYDGVNQTELLQTGLVSCVGGGHCGDPKNQRNEGGCLRPAAATTIMRAESRSPQLPEAAGSFGGACWPPFPRPIFEE